MYEKLMDYFNKQPRLLTLSTADKDGNVNAAYFGSPRMPNGNSIVMGSGSNRTLANLRQNPKACFLVMEPGETVPDWKGARIQVEMSECHTEGHKLEEIRAAVAEKVGPEVAKQMIHAALVFEIKDVRPLADFGQGWEKSIG